MTRARNVLVSVLAAGAVLSLSGCGASSPGAAAVIGDQTISVSDVDGAATSLCSANVAGAKARGQESTDLASRGARQGALQLMLDSAVTHQYARSLGVEADQDKVSAALQANAQGVAMLPASEKDDFRALLRGYSESQLMLTQIGTASLADQGASEAPTDEQAISEGTKLRDKWATGLDIEVDPRFGTYTKGSLRPGGGSLSVPVSQRAFEGKNADPSATWVAGLPQSQKCR